MHSFIPQCLNMQLTRKIYIQEETNNYRKKLKRLILNNAIYKTDLNSSGAACCCVRLQCLVNL